ncbi:tRNA adenosine(34) deaminase TadA [Aneurinibacillus sp. Ricciae_BoGa-3]|uniref:tRNA adenosine(34) deaminase TadA n=1 Tax=Aneurinibacillus sp. Ricciae_BoGa-3 TaxID=3022697 RepID=UPI0023424A6F|nr:tRNA adenosine(34) deaminase TadA [Aneurinibacillus sp. Ricciae_BoGa-3]WCK54598.1 tRNA adenosine(34) deaminase TadA [Aneurinibacillus sp. Ricciae_BoGa-3]
MPNSMTTLEDHDYMAIAIEEAKKAAAIGEVPIGAIIVRNGEIVGSGYNKRETARDPLAHAELMAIKKASESLGGWRLLDTTLYVTLEPCPMCSGAIVQARIPRIVYGAMDPKAGCAGSLMNLLQDPRFNHQVEITQGVMEEECGLLLKDFFRALREKRKKKDD